MIEDFVRSLGAWSWVIGGFVLVILELAIPGVFLVWIGVAAIATGLINVVFDFSWQISTLIFCLLSGASVMAGRFVSQKGEPKGEDIGLLNHRGVRLIGQVYTLDRPIENGEGKLLVGDVLWRISGPNLPVGARVKVIRADGTRLIVEAE